MSSRTTIAIKNSVSWRHEPGRWKQDYHPVELTTNEMLEQRFKYLHENPVRSGLVWEAWHYKYSSAIDYYTTEKGLLIIERIE